MDNGIPPRSSERERRPNETNSSSRGRRLTGSIPRSRLFAYPNFRISSDYRNLGSYNREFLLEPPRTRQQLGRGLLGAALHLRHEERFFQPNLSTPTYIYCPPPPSSSQSDTIGEFHSVPVFSGPFPISHVPGSDDLHDTHVVLGPFNLHNIPYIPGAIPIHHIPYIPGPDNVPHCPVLYEVDENDPNLAFPGYSLLVPVPFGAVPAVQLYIVPSEFLEGPTHVLIFQHGYIMPPSAHFLYLTSRDFRSTRENTTPRPNSDLNRRRTQNEENLAPPVIGLRIGRQTTHSSGNHRGRSRSRNYNRSMRNGTQETFRYNGSSFGSFRDARRRPSRRGSSWNNFRGRFMRGGRPLHSCGSNDPNHNCLWDQPPPRRRTNFPSVNPGNGVADKKSEQKQETQPPVDVPKPSGADGNKRKRVDDTQPALVPERQPTSNLITPIKDAENSIVLATPLPPSPQISPDRNEIEFNNDIQEAVDAIEAIFKEASKIDEENTNASEEAAIPEDEAPKKKENKKPKEEEEEEDPGEGTSSAPKRKSRYRPSYDYLRNPKKNTPDGEKVKIRNYDEDGNRVPTYRQAVYYCTKYHEKQSRAKLRKQCRFVVFAEKQYPGPNIFDEWLGDGTTSESESDSSFLTDEGGDETDHPNSKQMLAYYYEIKALKDEEKKKKKK